MTKLHPVDYFSEGEVGSAVIPLIPVESEGLELALESCTDAQKNWVAFSSFKASAGEVALLPDGEGKLACVLVGLGNNKDHIFHPFGGLSEKLPAGVYKVEGGSGPLLEGEAAHFEIALAFGLGSYRYTEMKGQKPGKDSKINEAGDDPSAPVEGADHNGGQARLLLDESVDREALFNILKAVYFGRDLINTPANILGPDRYEVEISDFANKFGAEINVVRGEALLSENFPMIHAVGRASDQAPRLIELNWGNDEDPKVTLVGKGICFDTGGLNLKPGNSMNLMKKDMGGSATALTIASMVMGAGLPLRLRVLLPIAENNISANSFRAGDVLTSRKGMTVEIDNTDAEGRLVLADALALADEKPVDAIFCFATLTGAARVAVGPDLPPFYTNDEGLAGDIAESALETRDYLWRLPLWAPYDKWLSSKIADVNHVSGGPFAGSITAALFLARFVEEAPLFAHFDIYGWTPTTQPGKPFGGEPQAARAVFNYLEKSYK
ncbi:MAG: leucyl aminopeptidase [Rhodomicrobium sp.]|nr:MAG: leucyl aminopeptidase [Rhodomicrobium sp.]